MATIDERPQWDYMRSMGKTRFVLRVFLTSLGTLLGAAFVEALFRRTKTQTLTLRDIGIKVFIALIFAGAYTLLGGIATWDDLEKKFGKHDDSTS